MADTDLSVASVGYSPAIRVLWEDFGQVASYVRADYVFEFPGIADLWRPLPGLEAKFVKPLNAGTKDTTLRLTMPADTAPFDLAAYEDISDVVEVELYEADLLADSGAGRLRGLFKGRMEQTTLSPKGRSSLIEVDFVGRKHRLPFISLGMRADDRCIWPFTGPGCGIDEDSIRVQVDIAAITGRLLTTTLLPNGTTANRYLRGWVNNRGVTIPIRQHLNQNQVQLVTPPPSSWLVDDTVSVTPGCTKDIVKCREYGNEDRHMALGIKMLEYDPRFEDPGGNARG